MPRPRNITDEKILKVAREVFLELGGHASTNQVAERLGISQAVLFQRFGTKEKLLIAALLPPEKLPWEDDANAGPDDRPLPEQMLELARKLSAVLREIIPCITVLKSSGVELHQLWKGKPESAPPYKARVLLTAWFQRAKDRGLLSPETDPQAIATAFMGALQARSFLAHIAGVELPPTETDPYLPQLVEILWRGLAPEEAR